MIRTETTLEIERPVEEVFDFLANVENLPRWTVGVLESHVDGPIREGTTGWERRKLGRKVSELRFEVTEFDPPWRLVLAYTVPFPATAAFTLDRAGRGTRITCVSELRPRGLWRLLSPLIARETRKTDSAQFARAREILEAGVS